MNIMMHQYCIAQLVCDLQKHIFAISSSPICVKWKTQIMAPLNWVKDSRKRIDGGKRQPETAQKNIEKNTREKKQIGWRVKWDETKENFKRAELSRGVWLRFKALGTKSIVAKIRSDGGKFWKLWIVLCPDIRISLWKSLYRGRTGGWVREGRANLRVTQCRAMEVQAGDTLACQG